MERKIPAAGQTAECRKQDRCQHCQQGRKYTTIGSTSNAGYTKECQRQTTSHKKTANIEQQCLTQQDEIQECEVELVDTIPQYHHYPAELIVCALRLFTEANLGFRTIATVLRVTQNTEGTDSPGFHAIRLWVLRFGLYHLQYERPRREDWVYVIDHSVSVDSLKCFIILGVSLSRMKTHGFNLGHRDVELLDLQLMDCNKADNVLERLNLTSSRFGCPVQIVSDGASELKKAVELFREENPKVRWIYDITHRLALLVSRLFEADTHWESLQTYINQSRSKCQLTGLSFLLPPKERSRSRWLNVAETVDWLEHMLALQKRFDGRDYRLGYVLPNINNLKVAGSYQKRLILRLKPLQGKPMGTNRDEFAQALQERLGEDASERLINNLVAQSDINALKFNEVFGWLTDYEQKVPDYGRIVKMLKKVQAIIKHDGLSKKSVSKCTEALQQISNSKGQAFEFEKELSALLEQSVVDYNDHEVCLGSSDVIESLFGKFKNQLKRTALGCMSVSVLSVVLHTCKINVQTVLESLTSIKSGDVSKWFKDFAGESLLALRKKAFKKGTKARST